MSFHSSEKSGSVHIPYNWEYDNATNRENATGFVTDDIGKLARQLDDDSLWMLIDTLPTWKNILGQRGAITAGTGLTKSGDDIRVGNGSVGNINGINRTEDDIAVATDNSTLEVSSNLVQAKDEGINTSKIAQKSITAEKLGSDVAGDGLSGGDGLPLNIDPKLSGIDHVDFDVAYSPSLKPTGRVWWEQSDYTLSLSTGLGPILQVGQELYVIVYNGTPSTIENGKAIYPVGGYNGRPSIAKANASTHVKILGEVLITTMDIPSEQFGIAARFGKVRDVNTNSWNLGDTLWVSATVDGDLTNIKPQFPNYPIQVGGVTVKDETNGEIIIALKGIPEDTSINFWNGIIRETIDFSVYSDGTNITGYLKPSNDHPDLTMIFSDGFTILDTSPPATINLIAGTDINPQTNYVYIPKNTKTLTVSTSSWPTAEHIKIAEVALRSALSTKLDGVLRNQNWNDHIQDSITFQGHLSHIVEKLRQFEAQWDSGIEGSVTIDATTTPDSVYVKTTAGIVYQMHKQNFPSFDMTQYSIDVINQGNKIFTISDDGDLSSIFTDGRFIKINDSTGNDGVYTIVSTNYLNPDFSITVAETIPSAIADGTIGDDVHVVNDSVSPFKNTTDLSSEILDALGVSLANRTFSFVLWGVQNRTGQIQHLMINLPTGSYSKNIPQEAVNDPFNYSVYSIPDQFKGVGFLISRFTFILEADGVTWSLYDTEDLRGKIPNVTAGGGGGGAGVVTFLGLTDTPSAYSSQALKTVRVNSGETSLEFAVVPINLYQNSELTSDSTTSTSYVPSFRYTTPILPIGKYKIDWSSEVWSNGNTDNYMAGARVQINDTTTIGEINVPGVFASDGQNSFSGTYFLNLTSEGQVNIDFDIKTNNATYAANIRNKVIHVIPVNELT
jgi:hypothetical protein